MQNHYFRDVDTQRTPASFGQRLLWILDRYRGAGGALNCPMLCRLHGPLDEPRLRDALTTLAGRHESLRTTFTGRGPRLTQVVAPPDVLPVTTTDLSGASDPETAVAEALSAELRTRIEPAQRSVRVTLWRMGPERHLLSVNAHHLVTDAWSCAVLFRELWQLYDGDAALPAPHQYREFATWQRGLEESGQLRRHEGFWRTRLADARLPELPAGPEPVDAGGPSGIASGHVPLRATRRLRQLARRHQTTPFAVMLALFFATLHDVTGQRDLTVSSVFANRSRPEHQQVVGFLANLVLLRTTVPDDGDFQDLLRATHTTVMDAFVHQALPYHMLPPSVAGNIKADELVFQMLAEPAERIRAGGMEVEAFVPDGISTRYRTELAVVPRLDGMQVLLFHTDLEPAYARDLVDRYVRMAEQVAMASVRESAPSR